MWTPGEIFTDPVNGIQVSVDAAYATGYRVTINTNPTTITTCSNSISPTVHFFGPSGGKTNVRVEAAGSCAWSARSNAAWMRVTSGSSGSGPGSVSYAVAANPDRHARTSTLTISGWTLTVTQAGTANAILFEDDMENGVNGWTKSSSRLGPDGCDPSLPSWVLTTTSSRSGTHAWTVSPGGKDDLVANLFPPIINLTEVTSATLTFWHHYDLGFGDDGSVAVRLANGRWQRLESFTGTSPGWQPASIDLTPFVGQSIQLRFGMVSELGTTGAFWYIDDVAVSSSDFVPPRPTQAVLENPQPHSFQSGIDSISGWACEAEEIVIELAGTPVQAAYGTPREDTRHVCGDNNNGFSLLVNWNNLGAGTHTVRALIDGVEFANTTVQVTTFGEKFLRGVSGTFVVFDFSDSFSETQLRWEQSRQNFVIIPCCPK